MSGDIIKITPNGKGVLNVLELLEPINDEDRVSKIKSLLHVSDTDTLIALSKESSDLQDEVLILIKEELQIRKFKK
ncbi:MAG: hypothetical protein A4E56_02246 [Pelotomaculum sp. PtaU1.Bin065]|nr:MAG: hypothetical protein A4E56_02246 [Pelotomaculum sp. PtaU1.Bin065]